MKSTSPILPLVFVFAFLATPNLGIASEIGISDDKILIGSSLNLSASGAERAAEIKRASDLVFSKINSNGGIHGRRIEVLALDDGYSPPRTFQNTKKLIEEYKVFALFQFFGTPNIKTAIPITTAAHVPFLFPTGGSQDLFRPTRKNVFTIRLSYIEEAEPIVDYLVTKKGIKNIAIAYQDDAAGHETKDGTMRRLAKYNLKPKALGSFRTNVESVKKAYDEIARAKPEAVILGMIFKPAAEFAKLAVADKNKWTFAGPTTLATKGYLKEAGTAADGTIVSASLPYLGRQLDVIERFKSDLRASQITEEANAEGYLNALVLVEALKRAGRDLTRDKLIQALESMKEFDLGGVKITFSPDKHFGVNSTFLSEVRNGEFHPIEDPPKR